MTIDQESSVNHSSKQQGGRLTAQQMLQRAQKTVANARQALAESFEVYRQIQTGNYDMDIYSRGLLRARIWELDQMFGNKGVFLSAAGQDEFLYETFFKNITDGIFLEIGGFNGWRGSNCYFFEKVMGWKGVIVEASPTWAKEIPKYRQSNIVHAAITDIDGEAEFMNITSGAIQMGGLYEYYIENRFSQVRSYPGHTEQKVKVPTMTLRSLLDAQKLKHVDYCSIDVEGAERSILKNFNFKDYDISVFSIENSSSDDNRSVRDILVPAGYRLVDIIGQDEIYAKNGLNAL